MGTRRLASRLYELRTYSLRLDRVRTFLESTEKLFHLRTQHSPLLGYWAVELGGLNQVVHVWEYDNLTHRAAVRSKVAGDPEWAQKYVVPVLNPAIVAQDNLLMRPLDGTTVTVPTGKGVAELQQFGLRGAPGRWQPALHALARSAAPAGAGSSLVGCFRAVVGPMNEAVLLLHHPSQDALLEATERVRRTAAYDDLMEHVQTCHSKLLLPQKFSAIQ